MVPLMQQIDVAINTRRLRPDPDLIELHWNQESSPGNLMNPLKYPRFHEHLRGRGRGRERRR